MKTIPLTHGYVAMLDDDDFERLNKFNWSPCRDGKRVYPRRNLKGKSGWTTRAMHQDVMRSSKSRKVDHRDGNGLNNQKHNLRFASQSQNCMNRESPGNKHGFKGIGFDRKVKKNHFFARLRTAGKTYYSAMCASAAVAALAYNQLAKEHFGEFAKLNKV